MGDDSRTTHTAFRLPEELLVRMDRFTSDLAERTGARLSRADIARLAIERLLALGVEVAMDPRPPTIRRDVGDMRINGVTTQFKDLRLARYPLAPNIVELGGRPAFIVQFRLRSVDRGLVPEGNPVRLWFADDRGEGFDLRGYCTPTFSLGETEEWFGVRVVAEIV